MSKRMKILIAYDGSECADEAINDLRKAGLPERAEALVLSVADVFLPPPVKEGIDDSFPLYVPGSVRRAHEHAARAVKATQSLAEKACARVKTLFPMWNVKAESCADSPAWAVIMKASRWKADLVIVGSHGHNSLGGRLILGSVSQRVLYEARCSVRIARYRSMRDDRKFARIIIGTDGSSGAESAITTVAARAWPGASEVRLIHALDPVSAVTPDFAAGSALRWVDAESEEEIEGVRLVFEASAERLRAAGLKATVVIKKGNPKNVLVEEAESWGADSIFVGAKGVRSIDKLLLGSVSSAVAARAHCSVEVVRKETVAV